MRAAAGEDAPAVAAAVRELLLELGGTPPATPAMEAAARALVEDPDAGALLLAEATGTIVGAEAGEAIVGAEAGEAIVGAEAGEAIVGADTTGAIIGVLGASWQTAIHVAGRYALIQDLWVHPAWRARAIGSELLGALFELARAHAIGRAEVGLPPEGYARLQETEAFYRAGGFTSVGTRMRARLS